MPKKSKIDSGRAMAILGFASSRSLDSCMGDRDLIRAVLDEALFKKTQEILHKPGNRNIPHHIKLKKAAFYNKQSNKRGKKG